MTELQPPRRPISALCASFLVCAGVAMATGCAPNAPRSLASLQVLATPGERASELSFGGVRTFATQSLVGIERRTSFVAPDAAARIEGTLCLRKHVAAHTGDRVRVRIAVEVEGKGGQEVLEEVLTVPAAQADNHWRQFRFDLAPGWRGKPLTIVYRSEFVEAEDPAPTSLAIGGPFLRVLGARNPQLPDLVVITLDTTRADRLGIHGGGHTPHLDALAARGAVVETVYSTANATNPAHASLFTSLHLRDHGVKSNAEALHHDALTLAEILRARGYETRAFLGVRLMAELAGLSQGFLTMAAPFQGEQRGNRTLRQVEEWCSERADVPLFLWCHFFDPHAPYEPTPNALRAVPGADGPPGDEDAERARYQAEIHETDRLVGALLEQLARRGVVDPLVVVVADHGESLGEHGVYYKHEGIHSTVTRIPLILAGPGIPAGVRSPALASLVDVMPTVLEALDLPAPRPLAGRSLLGALRAGEEGRKEVYFEQTHGKAVGLRTREHLYVRTLRDFEESGVVHRAGEEHLFFPLVDPGEVADLAPEHPELVREYRRRTTEFLAGRSGAMGSVSGELPPELLEELRAMGYTDGSEEPGREE